MAVYKRFTIQQKYLNGVPQEEYRLGMEYDPKAYHSMENCESGTECTQVEYRWIDVEGEYICEDTTKYAKQKRQQKCVDEEEWVDMYPYQYQKGEMLEEESVECGAKPKWAVLTIGATPDEISESFYSGLIVTPSKEHYDFSDVVEIKLPTISGNVLSNVNYGSTMAYGQTTDSSVLNLTMSNDWYVQANYRPIQSYYLGVGILGNGSVIVIPDNEDRVYSEGTQVRLIPVVSSGYKFNNWQYGSTTTYGFTTTNPQLNLTMDNNWYALANFSEGIETSGILYISYANTSLWGGEIYSNFRGTVLTDEKLNGGGYVRVLIDYGGIIETIGRWSGWYNLQYISMPMCVTIRDYAFNQVNLLSSFSFPRVSYVGVRAFYSCKSLTYAELPMCENINASAFRACTKLSIIKIGEGLSFVCSLSLDAFYGTAITYSTGSILVPYSLVDAYKTAENWSYFSDRIFPIE